MAQVQFKAKVRTVYNMDETIAFRDISIPVLKRIHCDMSAFRQHKKWGGLANSDLFPNILSRLRRDVFGGRDTMRLDRIPEGVTVDTSGFLAVVTFEA